MANIQYTHGDATAPVGNGNKIIVHVCNDAGGWGKGFVVAISKRWKEPEAAYRNWYKLAEDFELGAFQLIQVESNLWVANMIGQHGYRKAKGQPPVRYEAIRKALEHVAVEAAKLDASVHMPRIGCGLAGGKWEEIEPLLEQTLLAAGISTTVYDFP